MKNILFVIGQMRNGGAERVTALLAGKLIEYNYRVGIIIYHSFETEYSLHPQIKQYRLPDVYWGSKGTVISKRIARTRYIRKVIREFQPDCIIPILDIMAEELLLPNIGYHVPVIATVRVKPISLGMVHNILRCIAFYKSKAVFLQTESQKQFFSKKIQKKSFIVPNPLSNDLIEKGKSHVYSDNIREIVSLGRLEKQKNYGLLIEAMCLVHKKYPRVRLRIGGTGDDYDLLKKQIIQRKADTYIELLGWIGDVACLLDKSDLFVLPSDYEGFPNALMEAMALGLPCISTDCLTGPEELLGDNDRGLLVPVGDAEQMAKAILYMIEHHDEAVQYGIAARQYVEKELGEDCIVKKYIENLERI